MTLLQEPTLGPFEFVVALVLISTLGKVLTRSREPRELPRGSSSGGPGELEAVRDELHSLGVRLERLEEERDFYRELLEAPERPRGIEPPRTEEGPSGGGGSV